jgi:hypothetical protein
MQKLVASAIQLQNTFDLDRVAVQLGEPIKRIIYGDRVCHTPNNNNEPRGAPPHEGVKFSPIGSITILLPHQVRLS